ncbi:hypothetical protein EW146_g7980 [Bondarzewia mesenterica]|uniref:CSC1/OSCA1-like 7TM region domain-containing protein n=1 Tax=Bondarzewia mesenterica TaxID=1095465 RepID=A0A4S4LI06_9AGAM|nr:hypothetical protein EW146_g7980 [Bondarzewia mesenterica]
MFSLLSDIINFLLANDWDPDEPVGAPPGSPPTYKFEGPWFTTQALLSTGIGLTSFLVFCYCRTRWPLLFASRTKLKGFSPHEAHAHQAFFGWIIPTLKVSEFTVLQIVGLDAAVLLNFFKMSFYLFSVCSIFAVTVLMPVNFKNNIGIGDEDDDGDWTLLTDPGTQLPPKDRDWLDLISDANSYLSLHFAFTYLFTLLALRFIHKNYRRFIRARQLFSLELVHSIAARTVLVTGLPPHLRGERALAEHFEHMDLAVESVSVCREVGSLKHLLDKRTRALMKLEKAWVQYVGNPSTVENYDPSDYAMLVDVGDVESQTSNNVVVPHRKRPTLRPDWFAPKVDALQYLETQFQEADDMVRKRRRTKFKATDAAFVTFEKMSGAQVAAQTVHSSLPFQLQTRLAPEPRDIIWTNMTFSPGSIRARECVVLGAMTLLLFFWVFPITGLASLLSYKEIKKTMPWLARWIDSNDKIRAIVQNSLPSVAMITLNALLPFILEALTYAEGYRARSWIEYSLMKKYFLFLLVNVVFIFLLASTYWQLVRDLANSPAKIPEKLATALTRGRARHFFLSYVILQGLGIMPLQLLNLGVIIPRLFTRIFITRTPRDFAELNAPPMINYGVVYPQAILIFVITILYSVVQPLILIFGAIYFGMAYVVYKYKLLFVFYKPYESQGQAWPITFTRLIWAVIIFLVFMTGNFILNRSFILSSLLAPLIAGTVAWSWYIDRAFKPLSDYVSLSSVFEVQRGEETEDVQRLRTGHPVTWSQSNLNRRRYGQNDETIYVAPEDDRTDYSQPPMANWYIGVLNTGKRRYGHPALTGILPYPWLPLKKGETLVNTRTAGHVNGTKADQAVVLTLRKRYSSVRRRARSIVSGNRPVPDMLTNAPNATMATAVPSDTQSQLQPDEPIHNPWQDAVPGPSRRAQTAPSQVHHRLSYDFGSGVIALPDDGDWIGTGPEDDDSEDYGEDVAGLEHSQVSLDAPTPAGDSDAAADSAPATAPSSKPLYGTYYHHPERRRQTIPGAFPRVSS